MNIVLLEDLSITDDLLEKYINKLTKLGHNFTKYDKTNDPYLQSEYCKDADIIITANSPIFEETVKSAVNLKYIVVAFTGVDHIPVGLAESMNIQVSNASGYSTVSVAELCISYMIQLLRNTKEVELRCRKSGTKEGLIGSTLFGKTVGIIGYGKIGSEVAKILSFLGANVVVHSKKATSEYKNLELKELLKISDIISLHCPLNKETKNMINNENLKFMKSSAFLINTARGGIINTNDLIAALNKGTIAGAAVDVFDIEPPLPENHPILGANNLIVTPHIAYATKESMILRAEITFNNIFSWLEGKQLNKIC